MRAFACSFCGALVVLVSGCRGAVKGPGGTSTSDASAAKGAALPITGEWAVVHVKSYSESSGSMKVAEAQYELGDHNLVGTFNLDSSGAGTIAGAKGCEPKALGGSSVADPSVKPNVMQVVSSIFSIVQAVKGILDGIECSQTSVTNESMLVFAHHDWMGHPSKTLYKNVGVFGEGNKSADAECQSLRGFRIVEFPSNKTIMCIGYVDGAATKLRMLVQKMGDIHISRVDLVRPNSK